VPGEAIFEFQVNGLGGGVDLVKYQDSNAAIEVTADDVPDDGTAGEGDDVSSDVEDLWGGAGDDLLIGTAAANVLIGGPGDDRLRGQGGDDVFYGDEGNDRFDGGSGDDTVEALSGGGSRDADLFAGGSGVDTVSYRFRSTPLRVSLDGVADDGAAGERDNNRADVENVVGGHLSDVLIGNASANALTSDYGQDTSTAWPATTGSPAVRTPTQPTTPTAGHPCG